eukprot:311829-Chlamydomonas_euryale.AAC.1
MGDWRAARCMCVGMGREGQKGRSDWGDHMQKRPFHSCPPTSNLAFKLLRSLTDRHRLETLREQCGTSLLELMVRRRTLPRCPVDKASIANG